MGVNIHRKYDLFASTIHHTTARGIMCTPDDSNINHGRFSYTISDVPGRGKIRIIMNNRMNDNEYKAGDEMEYQLNDDVTEYDLHEIMENHEYSDIKHILHKAMR